MRTISIVKYAFTVIGVGLLIGAFFAYKNTQDFLKDALTSKGTVIELVASRSSDSATYRPLVKFKTQGGSVIDFTGSTGSNPPGYFKGEVVEVL